MRERGAVRERGAARERGAVSASSPNGEWLLRCLTLLALMATRLGAQGGDGEAPVDIDEVMCALCHFEQGDEFVEGIHYQRGMLLCNDCHGGDPFEARVDRAKAAETGFIGKPRREDIAAICGRCHSGPARFFAEGPHSDWQNADNPTCISCHHNHRVLGATLVLMDESCARCHAAESEPASRGAAIRRRLEGSAAQLARVAGDLDSLRYIDAKLDRVVPMLEAARSTLREADPRTHALSRELIEETLEAAGGELAAVEERLDESVRKRRRRRWAVLGVWLFVAVNVIFLWAKRRQLD